MVKVIQRVDSEWRATATLDGAFRPAWTKAGLGFGSDKGLEIWDGTARRVVVKLSEIGPLNRRTPTWHFSEDGRYVAWWGVQTIRIFRVSDGTRLVSRDEEGGSPGARLVYYAVFAGSSFRAYIRSGEVIFIDAEAPASVKRRSFGAPGSFSRNPFSEGSGWDENYVPLLSRDGRYLDVFRAGNGHTVYATE